MTSALEGITQSHRKYLVGELDPRPAYIQQTDSSNPTGCAASKFLLFIVATSYRRLVRDTAIHHSAEGVGGSSNRSGAAADVGLCLTSVNSYPASHPIFVSCIIAFYPKSGE